MRRLAKRVLDAVPLAIASMERIPPRVECVLSVLVVACAVAVTWILAL
jgi:hypothetical protein